MQVNPTGGRVDVKGGDPIIEAQGRGPNHHHLALKDLRGNPPRHHIDKGIGGECGRRTGPVDPQGAIEGR